MTPRSLLSVGLFVATAILTLTVVGVAPSASSAGAPVAVQSDAAGGSDLPFFPETGYGVANPAFADYFARRGGLRTFGYPVSNEFLLLGSRVQIFQRHVLQLRPDGSVALLNLLDDLFPVSHVNGSTLPLPSRDLQILAPEPGSADAFARSLAFVTALAPDEWNGLPVRFGATFQASITCGDAFPAETCDENLLPALSLEVWGLPTSRPAFDPTNPAFVYQRFQRGVMHFDRASGLTQALLLGDWFKRTLVGDSALPPDLRAEAQGWRVLAQYAPDRSFALRQPERLPATSLEGAFGADVVPATVLPEPPLANSGPATGEVAARRPEPANTPDVGMTATTVGGGPLTRATDTPLAASNASATARPMPTSTLVPTSTATQRPTATPVPTATASTTPSATATASPLPGPPVILRIEPPSGPGTGPLEGTGAGATCGETLTLMGTNLDALRDRQNSRVTFAGTAVAYSVLGGGGETRVQFSVPRTPGAPTRTRTIVVTTVGGTGSASYTLRDPC